MGSAPECSNTASGDDGSTGQGSEMDAEPSAQAAATGDVGPEPHEGMAFETAEDAWTFYNDYACRVGFNTRIGVFHRSRRDGSITSRQFMCAREGFRAHRTSKKEGGDGGSKRTRAVTRVGCKAMIRLRKQESGRWVVSKLHKAHNHELVSQSRANCVRAHRLLSDTKRSPWCSSIVAKEEPHEINLSTSFTQIVPQTSIWGGLQTILEYLHRMQAEDSRFFYAMQFEGGQCTGNAFWADARARMAYKHFGDVVTIDTSYKMSRHPVPFVSFTGVNHHGQPVLFGCALLMDDSESSLVWLFRTLLLAMSGCHPTSIISERDWIIQSAVVQVFPQTRHRLCKWHILKEGQDKLLHVYSADPSFRTELYRCINATETIDEFESSWEMLITRFDVKYNEWLRSLYNCRHQCVPVYLRNTFFAEISPTQRCEISSFFEENLTEKSDPQTFIQQYEKTLDSWYEKEVKADCDTMYTSPVLKTPSPMEKQAAEQYTRKVFKIFQEELIGTSIYTPKKINEEGGTSTYKVAKLDEEHKSYTVTFDASEIKATCSCQMFEYSGILCRHILTVFRIACVLTIPSHYILKRWTKNARNEGVSEINNGVVLDEARSPSNSQDPCQSLIWRYNNLSQEAIKFAENGATSVGTYNVAMRALQEAVKKVTMAKTGPSVNIPKEDHKNGGTTSQPSQGCNAVGLGQASSNLGIGSNGQSLGSSEPQLVAVPMVFYVPMINNIPSSGAGAANSGSSPGSIHSSALLGAPQVLRQYSQVAASSLAGTRRRVSKSEKKPVPDQPPAAPMNPIRAAAIAAGARIVPPAAAASLIQAVQSRIAIHVRTAGSSPANSQAPIVLSPFAPKPFTSPLAVAPTTTTTSTAEPISAPRDLNEAVVPYERPVKFTDSDDDYEDGEEDDDSDDED